MGDVAMTVPVVEGLRRAYPDMRITILTRAMFKPFFREIPGIEFMEFDPKVKHKGPFGSLKLADEIMQLDVDLFIDLHDVLRTKIMRFSLCTSDIGRSVINKGRHEKQLLVRRRHKCLQQLKTSVERYKEAVEKTGLTFELPEKYIQQPWPMPEEIAKKTGKKSGRWIGIAPFAQHRGKIYPIEHMESLIRNMNEKYEKVLLFGGGAEEKSFADAMENDFKNVVSVIGKINLSQELDVMSNLDVMITMDSSSMHMASLLGVKVVSVWGATHPFAGFYGFGQDPDNAVQLDLECRPCSVYGNKECIFKDYRCLTRITPDMIAQKVAKVLDL